MDRTILHIVCGDSRSRAEQARIVFALGHHAEVYSDLRELLDRPADEGIVMAADDGTPDRAREVIRQLADAGMWLPVVMTSPQPETEQVVSAIKAGALDYLRLPLEMGSFARRLHDVLEEADQHVDARRRQVEARRAVALLSRREGEVLGLLSAGCSNKEIARRLDISPRTVEIHRGNMMTKLRAGHAADAVRLWLDAKPGVAALAPAARDKARDAERGVAGRISLAEEAERRRQGKRQRQ